MRRKDLAVFEVPDSAFAVSWVLWDYCLVHTLHSVLGNVHPTLILFLVLSGVVVASRTWDATVAKVSKVSIRPSP